ncbi:hypothetical protein CsSME_00002979 [Camellia sinensis var. sinensis]
MALASTLASASDSSPLQDFCVAVNDSKTADVIIKNKFPFPLHALFVNGKVCKDPKLAKAKDFFFSGLFTPRKTSNPVGSTITPVNVIQIPGLNTLGLSLPRVDFAPYGLNPPHTHPLATEILVVLEEGFIHFQFNERKTNAVAISGLSSQNPCVITIANAVFGSNPKIFDDVLAKAFQVDKKVVDNLQAQFWWPNN